jgi:hypothetical protein
MSKKMTKAHLSAIREFQNELKEFKEREENRLNTEQSASEEYCEDFGYCQKCRTAGDCRISGEPCSDFANPQSTCRLACQKSCPQSKPFTFTKLVVDHPLHLAATKLTGHYKPEKRLPRPAERLFRKLLVMTGQLPFGLGIKQTLITSAADVTFENFLQTASKLELWCNQETGDSPQSVQPTSGAKLPAVGVSDLHLYATFTQVFTDCQAKEISISKSKLRRYLEQMCRKLRQGHPISSKGQIWKSRRLIHRDDWRQHFPEFRSWFESRFRFD